MRLTCGHNLKLHTLEGLKIVSSAQDWNPPLMRISELSEVSRVSKSKIHYYVRIGLLPPPLETRPNLYRYSQAHLHRLERIIHLKETANLPLEKIMKVLKKDSTTTDKDLSLTNLDRGQLEAHDFQNTRQIKRVQIIDKATMLFFQLGYEAVRISDITDALKMGKGTFYLHFKSKKELFLACFDRLSLLLIPIEKQDEIRDEKDFFKRNIKRWLRFNENFDIFSGVLSLIRTACRSDDKKTREKATRAYYTWIEPLKKEVEQAISSGIIRPMNAELATFLAVGMAESLSFCLSLDSRYSIVEAAELYYSILRGSLTSHGNYENAMETDQNCRVIVTDRDKISVEMSYVRFAGASYLFAKLGQNEMKVNPSKLTTISISTVDGKWFALLTAKSGQEISLEIDGRTIVTGDTPFGSLEIPIERLSHFVICNGGDQHAEA